MQLRSYQKNYNNLFELVKDIISGALNVGTNFVESSVAGERGSLGGIPEDGPNFTAVLKGKARVELLQTEA